MRFRFSSGPVAPAIGGAPLPATAMGLRVDPTGGRLEPSEAVDHVSRRRRPHGTHRGHPRPGGVHDAGPRTSYRVPASIRFPSGSTRFSCPPSVTSGPDGVRTGLSGWRTALVRRLRVDSRGSSAGLGRRYRLTHPTGFVFAYPARMELAPDTVRAICRAIRELERRLTR